MSENKTNPPAMLLANESEAARAKLNFIVSDSKDVKQNVVVVFAFKGHRLIQQEDGNTMSIDEEETVCLTLRDARLLVHSLINALVSCAVVSALDEHDVDYDEDDLP